MTTDQREAMNDDVVPAELNTLGVAGSKFKLDGLLTVFLQRRNAHAWLVHLPGDVGGVAETLPTIAAV